MLPWEIFASSLDKQLEAKMKIEKTKIEKTDNNSYDANRSGKKVEREKKKLFIFFFFVDSLFTFTGSSLLLWFVCMQCQNKGCFCSIPRNKFNFKWRKKSFHIHMPEWMKQIQIYTHKQLPMVMIVYAIFRVVFSMGWLRFQDKKIFSTTPCEFETNLFNRWFGNEFAIGWKRKKNTTTRAWEQQIAMDRGCEWKKK